MNAHVSIILGVSFHPPQVPGRGGEAQDSGHERSQPAVAGEDLGVCVVERSGAPGVRHGASPQGPVGASCNGEKLSRNCVDYSAL